MITGFIINAFYILVYNLFSILPVGAALPASIIIATQHLSGMMYSWNPLLPINELVVVIGLTIILVLSIFATRTLMYIAALLRGNSVPGSS